MADKQLADLTATTELAGTDLLFVETSAGPRKITAANAATELSAVTSVNGETGEVTLDAASVGADAAGTAAAAVAAAASSYATAAQGTKADTAVQPALVDAKGDLLVGSAADTLARLPVGTNDYVLTADSAEATGVKWAAASGGGGWSGHPFVSPTIGGSRRAIWPLGFNSHTTSGLGWQNTRAYAFWLPVERTLTALVYEVTSASGTGGAVATVGVSPLDENMLGGAATGWGQGSITSTGYKSVAIGVTMPAGWYAVWFRAGQGGCTVRGVNANGPIPAFAGDATTMNGVGGFNQQNWADDSLPVPSNWFNGIGQAWVLTAAPTVQNVALVLDEP